MSGLKEKGNHPCLSEDWLIDNLPDGWSYDCQLAGQQGFIVGPRETLYEEGGQLFIPLDLLKDDRNATERLQPGRHALTEGVVRLRGQGWTEEQIIDELAKVMAETLPLPEGLS